MSEFLSLNLTATLLGVSLRSVQRDIKTGKYTTRQVSGRGGKRYEIALSSLPQSAQDKYKNQQAKLALEHLNEQANLEPIPQAEEALKDYAEQQKHLQQVKESGLSKFALLPKNKKDHAKAKQRLLMLLYQYMRQTGLKKRPAIARFCAAVNRGLDDRSTNQGLNSDGLNFKSTNQGLDSAMDSDIETIDLHPVVRAVIPVRFGVQYLGESTLKQWLYGYENQGIIALVDNYSHCGRQSIIPAPSPYPPERHTPCNTPSQHSDCRTIPR